MKKLTKIVLFVLLAAMVLPAGYVAFAAVSTTSTDTSGTTSTSTATSTTTSSGTASTSTTTTASADTVTADNIVISQQVLDQIKQSDPNNYDKNLANYKSLLIQLNVADTYKQEIEKLIMAGDKLPDILIAYEFLYQSFGTIDELSPLVQQKASGKTWETVFKNYDDQHPAFTPRAFDSSYLQQLMNTPGITTDDIMIADRVSFVTGKSFKDVMGSRLQSANWKETNVGYGVLYSANQLPRVQITEDQMNNFASAYGLTQDQVAKVFVLAGKVGQKAADVAKLVQSGLSDEAIFAKSYTLKFD